VFKVLRCEHGQTLIEFLAVLPLLFLFLFGIMIFGVATNSKLVVSSAAREGARYAAIAWPSQGSGCLPGVRAKVVDVLRAGGLKTESPYFSVVSDVELKDLGDYVEVRVSYRQPTFLRTLGQAPGQVDIGSQFLLSSASVFRKEVPGP